MEVRIPMEVGMLTNQPPKVVVLASHKQMGLHANIQPYCGIFPKVAN
jgi:hypothetical protein